MELILEVVGQNSKRTVFLIGTFPGEVVSTKVVAYCEAAGCVWFN